MTAKYRWLALVLTATVPQVFASTIYNNLGPGNSFSGGTDVSNTNFYATTFTTTGAGNLLTVLTSFFSNSSPTTMAFYTDAAGEPGALLESWSTAIPNSAGLTTLTSVVNPFVSAGANYWFVITNPTPGSFSSFWNTNDQGVSGGFWTGNSLTTLAQNFAGSAAPAIQLNAIPEPATWALVALGCCAVAVAKKRALQP
jgi:hypothetical protein